MRIFLARQMRIFLALAVLWGLCTGAAAQALQPGDSIAISVYQDPKLDRQLLIGPTGMISFPLAGQLRAGGLTPQALENALRARLKDRFTGDLDITVSVVSTTPTQPADEQLKPRFFVTGEVLRPGPYIIVQRTTVLQGIALAGGLGPFAARQRIQIRRKIRGIDELLHFNYWAFEAGYDVGGNINLQPGDVIIVPVRGLFE